ncbi:hypothetical protein EBT25_05070 [bacterium]|nr:hypothetical protein [bacterium]
MSLIRVWTDVGLDKNVSLYARIIRTEGSVYTIQFLSPTDDEDDHGQIIYRYEEDTYDIDDDSITHYFHTDDETEVGFKQISEGAWIKVDTDSDEDYVPSESDDDDETDEEEEEDELTDEENEEFDEDEDDEGYYGEDD